VPHFAERSLHFLRQPRARGWASLFVLGIVASGLTGTSLVFVPFLALFLGLAQLAAAGPSRRELAGVCAYGASLAYLVGLAFYMWLRTSRSDYDHIGYEMFPSTFVGQFQMVFGEGFSVTFAVLAVATAAALVLTSGFERRFLVGWSVAALALALNPWSMPLASGLTTYNAYWRLFFLFPFPLVLGLACAAALTRFSPGSGSARPITAALGLIVAAGLLNLALPTGTTFGEIDFALGANKIDPDEERAVLEIIESSVPGGMIAPRQYSALIPMYTSELPQVCVRRWSLLHFAYMNDRADLAESRLRAWRYLSGIRVNGFQDLRALLTRDLPNVVLDAKASADPRLEKALQRNGYQRARSTSTYHLYTRSGS
jgi:hypothetical protein